MTDDLVTLPGRAARQAPQRCIFRLPEAGGRVLWQITNLCNYECAYCIFSSGALAVPGELTMAEACAAVDQFVHHGFRTLKITGGEPFARRDLLDILAYASDRECRFDLSTNASLVTPARARALALTKPEMVHVSVDGPAPEVNDELRGDASFRRTARGLEALLGAGVRLRVGCAVSRVNEHQLGAMVAWCAERGIPEVVFSRMEAAGRLRGNRSYDISRSEQALVAELEALRQRYTGTIQVSHAFGASSCTDRPLVCPGGSRFIYVDNLGRVAPCSWAVNSRPELLTARSLKSAVLGELLTQGPVATFAQQVTSQAQAGITGCPVLWEHREAA